MEKMPSPYREPGTLALSPPLAGTARCICRISAGGSKVPRPIALQNRVRSAAVLIIAPAESAQDIFSAVVSTRVFLSKIRYPVACGGGSRGGGSRGGAGRRGGGSRGG